MSIDDGKRMLKLIEKSQFIEIKNASHSVCLLLFILKVQGDNPIDFCDSCLDFFCDSKL
jgi:hypothetical protein